MTLISRNVYVGKRRTSIRLEAAMWDALQDIARRENIPVSHVCSCVEDACKGAGFTSSLRVFIMSYYRELALLGEQMHISEDRRPHRTRGHKQVISRIDQALVKIS